MQQRIDWIDALKGVGIICVVLGHCVAQTSIMGRFVNSFHMPLFFFVSGYLQMYKKTDSYKEFVLKRVDSLLIPYLVYSVVSVLSLYCVGRAEAKMLINVLLFRGVDVTWFLPCLFEVEVLGVFLLKIFGVRRKVIILWAFVSFMIGIAYNKMLLINILNMKAAFYGLSFWFIGGLASRLKIINRYGSLNKFEKWCSLMLLFGMFSLFITQAPVFGNGRIANPALYFVVAISGITAIAMVCSEYPVAFLRELGRMSLCIMCLHLPLLDISKHLFGRFDAIGFLWPRRFLTLLTLLILVKIVYLRFPILGGKTRIFSRRA